MFFNRAKRDLPHTPRSRNADEIPWGAVELPSTESTAHFLAVAATGGGKTTLLRLMQQSVLSAVGTGDCRAIIYDAKQDALPILSAFVAHDRLVTLNPFDQRAVQWDVCRDINEPRVAYEFACTLFPSVAESQPFFTEAARHLLYGVIVSYMISGYDWTFADLLRPLQQMRQLKKVIRKHPATRHIGERYFYDRKLLANVLSTVATKILPFEPIAACWEHATRKLSLHDWAREEWVLVLGNSEVSRAAIDAVNRCLFKRASDVVLNQSESSSRTTWFFIDELAEAGRLDGLVSLAKKGRSKGARLVLAFQSVSGLRDPKMYGPHGTDEILGQIGNRFIGRLECPATAEWASQLVGDHEVTMESSSNTSGRNGGSSTLSYQDQIRRAVLPSELMNLSPCNRENGLTGLHIVRSIGTFFGTVHGTKLFDQELIPPHPTVPDFLPHAPMSQILQPWTDEQAKAFGISQKASKRQPSNQEPLHQPELGEDLFT